MYYNINLRGGGTMKKAIVIEKDLHTDFKVECSKQGKQMSEVAEKLIREWLKK